MRILYVITRSFMGGAQTCVLDLIRAYSGSHEIGLVTGEPGDFTIEAAALGAQVFIVPQLVREPAPYSDILANRRLLGLIRDFHPDVVHCHTWKAGMLGRLAARWAGVPSVYTPHGLRFSPGAKISEKLIAFPSEWIAARVGDAVVAVSQFEFDLASRHHIGSVRSLYLIHNGIHDTPHRARPGAGGELNAMMVARFMPPKDQKFVLHALSGLDLGMKLWFVGDGPCLQEVQAEADLHGLKDRVVFLGERRDIPEILANAHLFVLASRHEALPISILEALRAGLPVIASDVGGVRECVRNGVTGITFASGNITQLQTALLALAQSPSRRAAMGAAGRQLYEEHFKVDQMLTKTLLVYQSLARHESVDDSQAARRTETENVRA